ncbi:MAG: hypothetical protein CBD69_000135 [Crocinitomicaceae bacterium TMED209]|nr:MAG: hypothetical protein CBD69_000135 [Crocinitomicaceae bacterium TMED209]
MEGGSLFNPGFLGGSFLWWVGQIADDSTWRKNKVPGKFITTKDIPGWGERYKVRIIGLHDQGESVIPSEELPWAQIMYPVTAGGGQARSSQTSNLRQGNMVFGFFMDGQDQQIPVIMGVLGNNLATPLSKESKNDRVTNEKPGPLGTSGHSKPSGDTSKVEENAEDGAPDDGLLTEPIVQDGETPAKYEPNSSDAPKNFTNESAGDSVHIQTIADVRRSNKYQECIPLMKPDDPDETIDSAMKGIQTLLDTLTGKIDGFLSTIKSYVDSASGALNSISAVKNYMQGLGCQMAKYMKVITDKMMEYTNKVMNEAMTDVVSAMPSHLRFQFSDIKEQSLSAVSCLYSKLSDDLCGMLGDILANVFDIEDLFNKASNPPPDEEGTRTSPKVPMCHAEFVVAEVIKRSKEDIGKVNDGILDDVNNFLEDMQNELAGVDDTIKDLISGIGGIGGNLTSALQFGNFQLDILGCSVKPQTSLSDCYQFASGSVGQFKSDISSIQSVTDAVETPPKDDEKLEQVGFLEPSVEKTVSYTTDDVDDELARAEAGDRSGLDDALEF